MIRSAGVCALAVGFSIVVLGQKADVPTWEGTWELDVQKSSFGKILFPGAPVDFALLSQRTKLESATGRLKMSADIVYSDVSGTHKVHEETALNLDGQETDLGPASLSFKRVDDLTFDIVTRLDSTKSNVGEVSHFVTSSDGRTLTETKTQTEREPVPKDADKNSRAVVRTSVFVLVFRKVQNRE